MTRRPTAAAVPLMLLLALLAILALLPTPAAAQSCAAAASPIDFGNVRPIRLTAVDASGSLSVSCTWPLVTLTPNVRVCLNLGPGTGSASGGVRYLVNGASIMRYNLYQDAARSQVWGSVYGGGTYNPISFVLSKPLLGLSASRNLTYYGRLEPNQPEIALAGGMTTEYASAFQGIQAGLAARFFALLDLGCAEIAFPSSSFPFRATARATNDCIITASDMHFTTTGLLKNRLDASTNLNVRCTNGNPYRISLSAGGSGNLLARRMQLSGGPSGTSVAYQLYTTSARTTVWGDGTAGTGTATGTGTGQMQAVTVYGSVPAQSTPPPGTYRDTIIVTIAF